MESLLALAISRLPTMTPEVHEHIRAVVSNKFTITSFSLPVLIAGKITTLYQAVHALTCNSFAS